MLKEGFHKLSEESSVSANNDKLGFADIGLDCDEFKNSADSAELPEQSSIVEHDSHQIGEISLHDMIVIEIVDRGGKSSCKHEHDQQLAEAPVKASSCANDTHTTLPEIPPREMELFKAEFSLERSTLLRSPYFAKLLCGSCKAARKLQLNLRDPHTNIEALIAASFFLDSGTHLPSHFSVLFSPVRPLGSRPTFSSTALHRESAQSRRIARNVSMRNFSGIGQNCWLRGGDPDGCMASMQAPTRLGRGRGSGRG
jgi:hypothetical protein